MTDQSDPKNVIIYKTLRVLVQQNNLTPEEVAQLRLSHLHLAGKNPSISFIPEGSQDPKVVALDMETHRALVGWLVNRPDSTGDFLFPGSSDEAMTPAEIRHAVEQAATLAPPPEPVADLPKPSVPPEADMPGPAGPPPPSPSRPVRPLSRPEMGAPPPGAPPAMSSFVPPPTAPEEDIPVNIPLPPSAPKPPASPSSPAVPPAPSRPVAVPRPPSGAMSRPEPPPSAASPAQPVAASTAKEKESEQAAELDQTMAAAKKPEVKEAAEAVPPAEKPEEKTMVAPAKKPAKVEPPLAVKKDKPTAQQMMSQRSGRSRLLFPGAIALILLCAACLAGTWFIGQSGPGSEFLASLGWSISPNQGEGGAGTAEETGEAVIFESALPTPTLPPTTTPTPLPPTNTPPPTDTATPTPLADTPTPEVTDTPTPTETPEPTDTPEVEEDTPVPATPTPGFKYPALELVEPRDGFAFIRGNTIVLKWQPVDLGPDEQYAVRLVYIYQGQPTYQGANIKEPEWTVPLSLFGQIDGPDNRYEWFVVVERLNDDGSGTAVSPESQHRTFTWK